MAERFADMLTGGHPNSLGRTVEVVDAVLADPGRLDELFGCHGVGDPVVRLRASDALRRLEAADRVMLLPEIDRIADVARGLDQDSARWTAASILQRNSDASED